MNSAVSIENLTKSYGGKAVLNGLDFSVEKGEIFALLGVNGAGKTTALECIEGLRQHDGGKITVSGKIGIQLQSASLPAYIKGAEAIRLFAKWNKTQPNQAMLDALGISELYWKKYADMSTGQKRRLHLALALVGGPDIVFLDEPAAGLDVEGRASLHAYIRKLKAQGRTVVLTSHDMSEVESLCDRIAILSGGKIVFLGTVAELIQKAGRHYTITISTEQGTESFMTDNISDSMLELLENCKQKGTNILDLKVNRGTLEQHFINIAKGESI